MKLYLFQVIVTSPEFHNSKWIAAENKKKAKAIVSLTLKENEKIEIVRKIEEVIDNNQEVYKIILLKK